MPSQPIMPVFIILLSLVIAWPAEAMDQQENVNETPEVNVEDQTVWIGNSATNGFSVEVNACSPTGSIAQIDLRIEDILDPISEYPMTACAKMSATAKHDAPGEYTASGQAIDEYGSHGRDEASIRIELIPFDLQSINDYPPLDTIPFVDIAGSIMTIQTIVTDEGAVRGATVRSNGQTIYSYRLGPPEPGDVATVVIFDAIPIGGAEFHSTEGSYWQGMIVQTGTEWWQIEPLPLPGG